MAGSAQSRSRSRSPSSRSGDERRAPRAKAAASPKRCVAFSRLPPWPLRCRTERDAHRDAPWARCGCDALPPRCVSRLRFARGAAGRLRMRHNPDLLRCPPLSRCASRAGRARRLGAAAAARSGAGAAAPSGGAAAARAAAAADGAPRLATPTAAAAVGASVAGAMAVEVAATGATRAGRRRSALATARPAAPPRSTPRRRPTSCASRACPTTSRPVRPLPCA